MSGGSFRQLRELQGLMQAGKIQVITPEAKTQQNISDSVAECSHLWGTRLEYAKALIAAGVPDAEVIVRAEALAKADHKSRMRTILELFGLHGGKVPEGLRYAAHMVDVDAAAVVAELAPQSPETALPATNGTDSLIVQG